ncbi:hypothetical protein RQP54_03035 [Curvibacter sp. APW13]|uniref:hypothetical protein n=1 Tax=Curvibacter sp. APW13 TaxID=3077236 RepID=UPI0028DF1B76|nr:hypothetical protein [Curvibacter sp. APW13]MDT8989828.1 hypothetical protein [Curvibacter sp. APW13]
MTDPRKNARISQALSRLYGVVVHPRTGQGQEAGNVEAQQKVEAAVSAEREQARALIAAIDAGGMPLNPARVNQIARSLGLEVSAHASMDDTIARIRVALQRP